MDDLAHLDLPALLGDRRWVAGIARGLVGDAELEDVAQDAWLAQRANPAGPSSNPRGWLARIVRSTALQHARRDERRARRERVAARPEALPGADELVAEAELRRSISQAVLELPEPYRTTILLRYYRDHSSRSIADLQGLPPGTVRSRLKRGLDLLRERLRPEEDGARATWLAGMAVLARSPGPRSTAAAGTSTSLLALGGMLMGTKAALVAGGLLVVATLTMTWKSVPHEDVKLRPAPESAGATNASLEFPAARDLSSTGNAQDGSRESVDLAELGERPADTAELAYRGAVLRHDMSTIAGASWRLRTLDADGEPGAVFAEGLSDADGRFVYLLNEETPTTARLELRAEGFLHRYRTDIEPTTDAWGHGYALDWVALLQGNVRDEDSGEALAGVRVSCDAFPGEVVSDVTGSYEGLEVPLPRELTVRARRPGHVAEEFRVRIERPEDARLDIALAAGLAMEIRVVDRATGAPIAGAAIHDEVCRAPFATSDATGSVRVHVPEGRRPSFSASAHGYCPTNWTAPADLPEVQVVPLVRPAWIEGEVVDELGSPRAGVYVAAFHEGISVHEQEAGPEDRTRFALPDRTTYGIAHVCRTTPGTAETDDAGAFRIPVAPGPDPVVVSAHHGELVPARVESLQANLPDQRIQVRIVLARGGTIRGRVTVNGAPWTAGEVRWEQPPGELGGRTWTDEDGRYVLERIPTGEVRVLLPTQGRNTLAEELIEVLAGVDTVLNFAWEEERAELSGRVVTSEGRPLADLQIGANSPEGDEYFSAFTGPEGRFALEVDANREYLLAVGSNSPWHWMLVPDVPAGTTDLQVVYDPPRRFRLLLHDSQTGAAAQILHDERRAVLWKDPEQDAYTKSADVTPAANGALDLLLPPGTFDIALHFGSDGYRSHYVHGVTVPQLEDPAPLSVDLTRGLTTTLRTTPAQAGTPKAPHHVLFLLHEDQLGMLRGPYDRQGGPSNIRVNQVCLWLGDSGLLQRRLELEDVVHVQKGLAPGSYTLVAMPDVVAFEPASFELVEDGQTVEVSWRPR